MICVRFHLRFYFILYLYLTYLLSGKPNLSPSLQPLTISCLKEHKIFLRDELEPLEICDFLFEEKALEILDHDKITEKERRRKQAKRLLKTIKRNKNCCFHFFLYILQKKEYKDVLDKLERPASETIRAGMFYLLLKNSCCFFEICVFNVTTLYNSKCMTLCSISFLYIQWCDGTTFSNIVFHSKLTFKRPLDLKHMLSKISK